MSTELPPVAPEVLAEAVENLTARLRKKLDAATEDCAAAAAREADGSVTVRFGEDALVTLRPGPSGTVTEAGQATCSCLLAPRCLHRAAALGAAPLADAAPPPPAAEQPEPEAPTESGPAESTGPAPALTEAQLGAATALWHAAAEALAAGVTAGGAVVQAELLRAAHTARLAGLPRAEAAALRVVRGLRAARERRATQRLGALTGAFRELLHTAGVLACGTAEPALTGTARRAYAPGGSLQVHGLCREPVLSATGYGGVVTHLLALDGARYSVSDVRPGGLARARGAGSASVSLGGAVLDHAGLARGGLRIVGATVSAEGRLGAGREVRATPLRGTLWTEQPAAPLFARPAAEAIAELLADPEGADSALLGCDVTVVGAAGEHLLVREARPDAPLLRLLPAHPHPELPHTANLRRIAGYPGLQLRVLGRPDLDRAATLRPLAVGPVPGAPYTLRLPEEWLGRADLGYDRLQGVHFPPRADAPGPVAAAEGPDPLADSPLWRVRRLLETGVAGGRRAVAEAGRGTAPLASFGPLRRAGLTAAAELSAALAAEADRRPRNAFGRLTDPSPDGYAWAWLAAATHLAAAERSLVAASWAVTPNGTMPTAP
ncbi:SWIM zinc finger family protein [Streptomyces sp. NRRL F-2580]|uniref:SWIM zinc finger family protein n=1 Tax=Streptomyces sp. NRRL F-2580 TaxID=1463841 RepID=UPI0004CA2561|nr:SWIM zinc finger family protein [Streptomyces sp. NRRL F-2580]